MIKSFLIGAGGHAKVVLDQIDSSQISIEGVVDPKFDTNRLDLWRGLPAHSSDQIVMELPRHEFRLINGVGSLPGSSKRQDIFHKFKRMGFEFMQVIHPSAVISPSVRISEGVQIMAGCVVQSDTVLGENVILNTRSSIDHDCVIGAHTHVAPGAVLSGGVRVGKCCHIGTGACVIHNIEIGNGAVLSAGACLYRHLRNHAIQRGSKLQIPEQLPSKL